MISHQWLDFCLACSMYAAYLQHAQGVLSSFIGCSGHIESIKLICDEKVTISINPQIGPTWPRNLCARAALFPYGSIHWTMYSIPYFKNFLNAKQAKSL